LIYKTLHKHWILTNMNPTKNWLNSCVQQVKKILLHQWHMLQTNDGIVMTTNGHLVFCGTDIPTNGTRDLLWHRYSVKVTCNQLTVNVGCVLLHITGTRHGNRKWKSLGVALVTHRDSVFCGRFCLLIFCNIIFFF
jgi:hypothetical protein